MEPGVSSASHHFTHAHIFNRYYNRNKSCHWYKFGAMLNPKSRKVDNMWRRFRLWYVQFVQFYVRCRLWLATVCSNRPVVREVNNGVNITSTSAKNRRMNITAENRKIRLGNNKGYFHSCRLQWDSQHIAERKEKTVLLRKCVKIILEEHVEDNMKAPRNNKAKSALLSKVSFDIYFGDNIEIHDAVVIRTAYGTGSGQSSIGLDPRHKKYRQIFPLLSRLRDLMRLQVERYYNSKYVKMNCCFNFVSVKVYVNGMKTPIHTDVELDKETWLPKNNNSQIPGTPVAIATIGNDKVLRFIQFKAGAFNNEIRGDRVLNFVQRSGDTILLDPRDEQLNNRREFWKHEAEMVEPNSGCSVSLMFRVVGARQHVSPWDSKIPNVVVYGTGLKEQQFDDGWKKLQNPKWRKEYEEKVSEIRRKMEEMVAKYCDSSIDEYLN